MKCSLPSSLTTAESLDAHDVGSPVDRAVQPLKGFVDQILRQWASGKELKARRPSAASASMVETSGNRPASIRVRSSSREQT